MAVSSGFFNSQNHDRVYDAVQLSSIFDGIIRDGIIQNYPDSNGGFKVSAATGMNVTVAAGRAWYNHTWTLNDAAITLKVDPASSQPRIDSVILKIDQGNRRNDIVIKKGTPAANPSAPSLVTGPPVWEYRIADIRVNANATAIVAGNITDKRGADGGAAWAAPIVGGGSQYVQKAGDTMSGQLTLKQMRGTSGSDANATYGPTLPTAGTAGRIFFKTM